MEPTAAPAPTVAVTVNGKPREVPAGLRVAGLLASLGVPLPMVAVERNGEIVPRRLLPETPVEPGDVYEIVTVVGGGAPAGDDPLRVGAHAFGSRLVVGTGKYPSPEVMRRCHEESGAEMVTVAIRRIPLGGGAGPDVLAEIDRSRLRILPNTAGCYSADEAIRVARLAREALGTELVKLEVIGDERTLWPEVAETVKAAQALVKEGFTVMAYTSDDPVFALRLQDAGCASVMPLGAPIGSGQGLLNPAAIRILRERLRVPMIVDAGVGTASDVSVAFELGADGVLLNTGIAAAKDPVRMARACRHAAIAGREAFLAGRMERRLYASASSPAEGRVGTR